MDATGDVERFLAPSLPGTILILAAGDSERWFGKTSKHLISIAGEPLLERTIRQVRSFGYEPIIVTHKPELAAFGNVFTPKERRWICETLMSTRELWGSETTILLGDVVWPDRVLSHVLKCEISPRFLGNYLDIFAVSWNETDDIKIINAAIRVLTLARQNKNTGKLWHLYQAVIGADDLNKRGWDYSVFEIIPSEGTPSGEFTQDFDVIEDYQRFLENNPWAR